MPTRMSSTHLPDKGPGKGQVSGTGPRTRGCHFGHAGGSGAQSRGAAQALGSEGGPQPWASQIPQPLPSDTPPPELALR